MISKGRCNLRAYIEDIGEYLTHLLCMYPNLLDDWMQDKEKEHRCIAKESSNGDVEVEASIFQSLSHRYDCFMETEVFFYDAMFIMVYSYYESVLTKLAKKYDCCKNWPSCICERNNIKLSDKAHICTDFLFNKIEILRNQICHNFLGTIGAKKKTDKQVVKKLFEEYPDAIRYDDNSVHILKGEFISEVLEKEKFVLNELINKLNL